MVSASKSDGKIRILFLIDRLLPGGTEGQLLALAAGLPAERFQSVVGVLEDSWFLRDAATRATSVCLDPGGNRLSRLSRLSRLLPRMRALVNSGPFDVVQTHVVHAPVLAPLAMLLMRNRPLVVGTRRNLYHWIDAEPFLFRLYRTAARRHDHFLLNSHAVLEACRNVEGIPGDKMTVIENGVDLKVHRPRDAAQAKRDLGLPPGEPVVGAVGNWRPVKGMRVLLEAAPAVLARRPDARFVLVGRGAQKEELTSLARSLRIDKRVRLIENHEDMPGAIAAFDVAVQPSLSESFSNVLIEYMAAGKPVVATRVGDAGRIIEDGKEGLLVSPSDSQGLAAAVARLLDDPEGAARIGAAAHEKVVRTWGMEAMIARHAAWYEDAVQRRAREMTSSNSRAGASDGH